MRQYVLLIFISVLLLGCDAKRPVTMPAATPAAAATSESAAKVPSSYQTSGPVVVENQVEVAALREGVVAKILVEAGARVRQGNLLAQLDDRQIAADREAANADVHASEANLKNWEAESKVLEADLARDEELWKAQLITAQQVEHSRYKLQAARFQSDRDQNNVIFFKAKLRSLELELEKTRIRAPFDGVVARRYARAGQKVAVGDRLFWVTATGPMRVHFTVPQEFAGKLKRGDAVSVSTPGSSATQEARVTLVSPVVDPASGTLDVQAQLPAATKDLLPGMTVNINVRRAP